MLAKKVCKSLKILFKIIGNLCSCMSSVNSSLKCQNQTLEINFFRARIVFRNKLFKKKSKIFVRSIERVGVQIVEYWWQTLASWHSYKFEGKYGRLQYEGCGGISDYNLHQNNNKMEIFSKHILNTANPPCEKICNFPNRLYLSAMFQRDIVIFNICIVMSTITQYWRSGSNCCYN